MHAQAASPVALVLPLPRRTPSLRSFASAASPRTPRSCGSPCASIFVPPHPNRKSTDSWNSSNGPDESEYEWKPEQVLLLSRTLDALPAHLVTPFNGPIPPSNLLDKIARGVSQAKGPVDWPHSLRATRVKLIELSRLRAKEQAAARQQRESIAEELEYALEMESNYVYSQNGTEKPIGAKKPLYRQSSMDFMLNAVGADIQHNENLTRLSNRLQRAERQNVNHPYQHPNHLKRPSSPTPLPSLINPSTPSSSTLNTLSSSVSHRRIIRRTASSVSSSSLSILSSSSSDLLPASRVRPIMEYDELPPTPPPKDVPVSKKTGTKRAPSFGALAQGARREYSSQSPQDDARHQKHLGGCASSDEEEKVRNKQVKKPRKQSLAATPPPDSPAPITPLSSPVIAKTGGLKQIVKPLHLINFKGSKSPNESKKENKERVVKNKKENAPRSKGFHLTKPLPTNSHHSSTEPPELTDVQMSPAPLALGAAQTGARSPPSTHSAPRALKSAFTTPLLTESPNSISTLLGPAADINPVAASPKVKTLRRVRRLAPARRISFSSLVPPGEEADADGEGDGEEKGGRIELGSAFQLH